MPRSDWRQQIENALGFKLLDKQWSMRYDTYVDELEHGQITVAQVAKEIQKDRDLWSDSPQETSRREPAETLMRAESESPVADAKATIGDRQYALSAVYAAEAAADPWVLSFRERHLPDGLIEYDDVESWLKGIAEREGAPSLWMKVPLPDGVSPKALRPKGLRVGTLAGVTEPPLTICEETPASSAVSTRFLAYGTPDNKWRRIIPTRAFGVLEELRELSERLVTAYNWDDTSATVFVLTGWIPIIPSVHYTLHFDWVRPTLSRITMVVDPALTPDDMKERYREVRNELIGSGRYRPQSLKMVKLARHCADRASRGHDWASLMDTEDWASLMAEWNQSLTTELATWRYAERDIFSHDCRAAVRTLLQPSISQAAIRNGPLWLRP
jgi:hypothetical protein